MTHDDFDFFFKTRRAALREQMRRRILEPIAFASTRWAATATTTVRSIASASSVPPLHAEDDAKKRTTKVKKKKKNQKSARESVFPRLPPTRVDPYFSSSSATSPFRRLIDTKIIPVEEHGLIAWHFFKESTREREALERLRKKYGASTYVVGGAIRDLLLYKNHRKPFRDVDFVTTAGYKEIKACFGRRARLVGKRFSVALINMYDGKWIEMASIEQDPGQIAAVDEEDAVDVGASTELGEGLASEEVPRTPSGEVDYDVVLRRKRAARPPVEEVEKETTDDEEAGKTDASGASDDFFRMVELRDNAYRRDFTVNAMFFDPYRGEILDFVGGMNDLHEGVVRTVQESHESLKEDPVRMLRAIRLAARHDFVMTKELRAAMRAYGPTLKLASARRVMQEIQTLMENDYGSKSFALLWHSKLTKFLFPVQHEFLKKRMPPQSTLTFEASGASIARKDTDKLAKVLFRSLSLLDTRTKKRNDMEKSPGMWLALLVAPVAMARLSGHPAWGEGEHPLPRRFTDRNTRSPKKQEQLTQQWEAFTVAVMDVLDEMLEKTCSDSGGQDERAEIGILNRSDCAVAFSFLLGYGPLMCTRKDASGWSSIDLDDSPLSDRIRSFVRSKRGVWFDVRPALSYEHNSLVRSVMENAISDSEHDALESV